MNTGRQWEAVSNTERHQGGGRLQHTVPMSVALHGRTAMIEEARADASTSSSSSMQVLQRDTCWSCVGVSVRPPSQRVCVCSVRSVRDQQLVWPKKLEG